MRLFIGYTSALYFWLRGSNGLWAADPCRVSKLAHCAYNVEDINSFTLPRDAFGPGPLHVMVDSQNKRRSGSSHICHAWSGELAEKSFVPIGHNVFVASPSLCYLQAAQSLSFFELAELGYELCGLYSRTPGAGRGFVDRYELLANPKQIALFCEKHPYARNSKQALRAIKRVMPKSKSPAETDMAIKTVFSLIQGGYGLPMAELNGEVQLSEEARLIVGQPSVYPDELWRKKGVCLEYDSKLHHESSSDRTRDSRKRNALGCMGFKVITVTPSQLTNVTEFDGIAIELARHLGVRIRPTSSKTLQRRFELNEAIKQRMRNDLKPIEWPYI